MLTRCVAYALQESFKKKKKQLETLQEHQILAQLGVDEIAELCNSFVILPKSNGIVHMYLYPLRLKYPKGQCIEGQQIMVYSPK